jgi:hypothetical protein
VTARSEHGTMVVGHGWADQRAMAEHDERRTRGSWLRGMSRRLGFSRERRQDLATATVERELADVLSAVATSAGLAELITSRAGFPVGLRPVFDAPLLYWSTVITRAADGMASLERLLAAALEQFPHNPRLRALEQRLSPSSTPVSSKPPVTKVDADEFASLLDRHSPWSRFLDRCATDDHLVMWVVGDPRQNVSLFYERIRSELSLAVEHRHYTFGSTLGDGTVATQWAMELTRKIPGSRRGMTLPEALRAAAHDRRAIFLLDNQRGVLEDNKLSPRYVDELVRFVTESFVPAAIEAGREVHPVRLFLGIQTGPGQRKSMLAKAPGAAMRKTIAAHGDRFGMWEEEEIELPTWNDVKASIEELLPRTLPLDDDERDELEAAYEAFCADEGGTLVQLAQQLYPLYERFYAVRERSTNDG